MGINFPNAPAVGDLWPSPPVAGVPVYKWDGAKWTWQSASGAPTVFVGDTPPTGVSVGSLWWESDSGLLYIYYNDGDSIQWVIAAPTPA
jgi:hypothetical protein